MELSLYTIRSKQEYIYRTNKIVEIVGASENISNAWNVLFEQAQAKGLRTRRAEGEFSFKEVKEDFKKNNLDMAELFCGGGNDTVLFRDRECYIRANKAFSYCLLEQYPGMIPMSVSVHVTGDYRDDYAHLMEESDIEKNRMIPGRDQFILPFSLMDRDTFLPMTDMEKGIRYPKERLGKRKTGIRVREKGTGMDAIKLLDDMVTKRGEESLLAVIHADGNNMGNKIMEMLGDRTEYDYCVNAMRRFTADTSEAFVTYGLAGIARCQKELMEKYHGQKGFTDSHGRLKESMFAYRKIISDGDDMTFICNARFAMAYTRAYVKAVQNYQKEKHSDWTYSSCAGICIFHSHYSFAQAYQLAEKACDDGAKDKVHLIKDGKVIPIEEGWADFHYIHSGVGGDLETIRKVQGTADRMARPWRIDGADPMSLYAYEKLEKLVRLLKEFRVSRTDIKSLGIDWEDGTEAGLASLRRVLGHHPGLEEKLKAGVKWDDKQLMKAIYDLAEVYDLWFAEE